MAAERESNPARLAKYRRVSVFHEVDVDGFCDFEEATATGAQTQVRFGKTAQVFSAPEYDEASSSEDESHCTIAVRRPLRSSVTLGPQSITTVSGAHSPLLRVLRFTLIFFAFLVLLHHSPLIGKVGQVVIGVEGGVIRAPREDSILVESDLVKRQNSPTDVCTRFSHQTAIVNGTLYVYGGHATNSPGQKDNTWNNDFLKLDVTKTWQIGSPTLQGLPQPSGPPPVSNGYLWNSYDSLFLYGGEYSDKPTTTPVPFALWEYQIASSTWKEHKNPQTSSGINSEPGNQPVQEAAEGAGFSVPQLGRGWYFGGHLDPYTTAGWAQWFPRVYLKSMIEFTFPGYPNSAIDNLKNGQTAGSDGAWRNITQGGLQSGDGFPERADGVLVYVPGYGDQGILLGLTGGTNTTFTQTNVIDVFDIATSKWYKQPTAGTSPPIRVNTCAVAASAADGSSTNIYMYGGQNLVPAGDQIQYDDMWILTVPSFTWIEVDQSGQAKPPPRAGHSCNIWDAQMIVVGGYVPANISCDSPGIYIFDASQLKWVNQFTALDGGNALNQQESQNQNNTGLSGSYGYQVPAAVQAVIGGVATGAATATAPAVTPTDGPLATGKPITYTVTGPGGSTVTQTAYPTGGGGSSGPNIAAIVAGVVAGVLLIIACYLGFCAYVYRKQLRLYKNHVAMSQRAAVGGPTEKTGFMFGNRTSAENSSGRGYVSTDRSSGPSGNRGSAMGNSAGNSGGAGAPVVGDHSTANSSTDDLMMGQEPSFVGVLLNPRRSLRVINRD